MMIAFVTKFAIFFPIFAAILWGVSYALFEDLLNKVSVATITLVYGFLGVFMAFIVGYAEKQPIDFKPILSSFNVFVTLTVFALVSVSATLLTTYATKHISATYASIGEIAYPIFTVLFIYLIYGVNQLNLWTVIGGLLVMSGICVMVFGQKYFG